MVSLALRVALERTAPKNVSAIMEGRVTLLQANVTAVQDIQGNGKEHSCVSRTSCNGMKWKFDRSSERF